MNVMRLQTRPGLRPRALSFDRLSESAAVEAGLEFKHGRAWNPPRPADRHRADMTATQQFIGFRATDFVPAGERSNREERRNEIGFVVDTILVSLGRHTLLR